MTHRPRLRSLIAVAGATLLTLGPGLLIAAPAEAAPAVVTPVLDSDYPLGGDSENPGAPEKDPQAERAEKFGGNTVTDLIELGGKTATNLIEMGTDVLKCGLNVVAPTVKCD